MEFFLGIAVMFLIWISAEKKENQCSIAETVKQVTDSIAKLFASPEQSADLLADPEFRIEMEDILNKYSNIPTRYTFNYSGRSDLPFYVCQLDCCDKDKAVVGHLIRTAVASSLSRRNIQTEILIDWIQHDGMPAVKCTYASTRSEHEILDRRIDQIRHSKLSSPVIDEELEKELTEYGC